MMDYDSDDDYIELDSDQEAAADSSDDEINIVLHGTPEQRRKLEKRINVMDTDSPSTKKNKRQKDDDDDSSEDEFEKEMAADLDTTMKSIEQMQKAVVPVVPGSSTSGDQQANTKTENDFYDNDYFDSDSDEDGSSEQKKSKKRPKPTNDDLLYDPNADDDDQKWVDSQRRRYQPRKSILKQSSTTNPPNKPNKLPSSDAVLNCPACMVQLCLDCQRHAKYNNQYRAMFVMNCSVNYEQRLKFPKQKQQKGKKKKKNDEPPERVVMEDQEDGEFFHPVKCSQCTTEVGVFDSDEVFHFFNVLASHS